MSFPFPISPSAINTARQCWRKLGLEYIDGVKGEPNEYAELGTEFHAVNEDWFTKGIEPNIKTKPGKMSASAIVKWPAPCDVDEVEVHVFVQTDAAVYHGYQDIGYYASIEHLDAIGFKHPSGKKRRLRVVGDHKSCGDHKWNKCGDDLKSDPQAIVYSAAAMIKHNVDEVLTKWEYTTRNTGHKTKTVLQLMTRADVEAGFDSIDETARDIYYVRTMDGITGMDLPPNPSACGDFGGCPHVELCNLSVKEKLRGYMAQQTLREKILAKQAAKTGGAVTAKPAGKPVVGKPAAKAAPKEEAATETTSEKLKRLAKEKKEAAARAEAEAAISDEHEEEYEDDETDADDEVETETEAAVTASFTPPTKPAKPKPSKPAAKPAHREPEAVEQDGVAKSYTAILDCVNNGVAKYRIDALDFDFEVSFKPSVVR